MDTETSRKFCPICKQSNEGDAVVCQHCGEKLDDVRPTTLRVNGDDTQVTRELNEQTSRELIPPARGVAVFLLNKGEPIALRVEDEFVLGRIQESTSEPTVDLTDFDGYALGVSRRHALVRAVGERYVLIDLNSSNGTWLNGQLLIPTKPYDLPNGAVVQLGRIKLMLAYMTPVSSKN
jgi:pSer/pThr/pTyr-binding forkhead associated (FHA) protein